MSGFHNILVIGSGSIGRRHHQNLQALGVSSTLVSYQANTPDQLLALLDDKTVSAVVLATATQIRTHFILACAQRNLPVYIEKPLAFTLADLDTIYANTTAIAERSMVGFMMRYHPLFTRLAEMDLKDTYRFNTVIGHDVTQWRSNWRFSDSYAALPKGGGVLLDLCHELDMAACLFSDLKLAAVQSIGHRDFSGVDFSTDVSLVGGYAGGSALQGCVSMDYLSPVSTRKCEFYGKRRLVQIDFNALQFTIDDGQEVFSESIGFDRNDMFVAAMADFLALVDGGAVSDIKHFPRLDMVRGNCTLIAQAWEQRTFTSKLSDPVE